jgi:hypothetical protein
MRKFWRVLPVVAFVAAVGAGAFWWLNKPEARPVVDSRPQTKVTEAALPLPAADTTRLQKAINSPEPSKRAEAYAPGAVREAYKANATSTESGGIVIDAGSFKQLDSTAGEVDITIPNAGKHTFLLAKVKTNSGEQWFLTTMKE